MLMTPNLSSTSEACKGKASANIHSRMADFVTNLQNEIVSALEVFEGEGSFLRDKWTREEGGFGTSCVLQKGKVFEKAGVNVSIIKSPAPTSMIHQMRASRIPSLSTSTKYDMAVAGISLVIHPHNPHAPTVHLNYRYFELLDQNSVVAWWFGGGSDLTPAYLYEEDCIHFHGLLKNVCDKHDTSYYPRFKKWCDEYFTNTHRGESRGIGGIFFDDLDSKSSEELFEFVSDCGKAFIGQYMPLVEKRKDMEFTPEQKEWQQLRRGRYVEFNLVNSKRLTLGP
jgi:coproporphyrinogen III oxidase